MATNYDQLESQLLSAFDRLQGDEKHWIGLAGAPGSGKTTVAEAMRRRMPGKITVIPMDGYHYYRAQLDAMDDPREAHARRGRRSRSLQNDSSTNFAMRDKEDRDGFQVLIMAWVTRLRMTSNCDLESRS